MILFANQRGDIRLNSTRAKSNNDDGNNETREGAATFDGRWNRRQGQDEKSTKVDTGEYDDSSIFAEILISNDGTDDGRNIAPELEKCIQRSGRLLAFAKCAWLVGGI